MTLQMHGGNTVVSVTLSNTGDSTIENWMLYFDPNGQVHSTVNVQEAQTCRNNIFRNSDITPMLIRTRQLVRYVNQTLEIHLIQNNTHKPIESWELTVDTNFTI